MVIGIFGYGNLGRGVELAVRKNADMELLGVFTRRSPYAVDTVTGCAVRPEDDVFAYADMIDVLAVCGGSAADLPEMTPRLSACFNVVDSFDTHARIPAHFEAVDTMAKQSGHVALISAGWDPGMFSLARMYASAILPDGDDYTFWGRGVSQGHSEAVRRIAGVKDARQYTVPRDDVLECVKNGGHPVLSERRKHTRECYVVPETGADLSRIEEEIMSMPYYFAGYDTTVTFISEEEMKKHHSELPHGGCVIRNGRTGVRGEHSHTIEYSLRLDSNPEFTAGVITAFSRAVYRMHKRGETGCKTVFDIVPADLSALSAKELRRTLL